MTKRTSLLVLGASAALAATLASAGCGPTAQRFDQYAPAPRLLILEAEGPGAKGTPQATQTILASDDALLAASAAQLLGAWAAVGDPYLVLPALTHPDPLVRGIAQTAYIENHADGLAPLAVEGALVEVPPAVLAALEQLHDPQGMPDLTRILTDRRDKIRERLAGTEDEAALATDLLARIGDAGALRTVGRLAESGRAEIRAKAASACVRDDMGLGPSLLPAIARSGTVPRRAVMRALVLRPDARLKDVVAAGLDDLNEAVRRNAIRAAANLGAAAPVDRLAEKLRGPSGEKPEILLALGAIGRPAAPALRDYILKGPATDNLRIEALLAFGPQAGREDVAWIAENLKSKNKYIRAAAASALGQIGHPSAQAALMLAVNDAEPIVRATVARALGQVGTTYAGKQLVPMLDDPSALVRSLAAWGLGQSRYPDAVPALVKMARTTATATEVPLRAGHVYGRPEQAAVEALGKIGTPEAVAAILEALESPSWLLRATAAQALSEANCRNDNVLAALEKRLDDPVNLVRANALLALRTLGKTFPAGYFQER
jgi:HEAT repeat protein